MSQGRKLTHFTQKRTLLKRWVRAFSIRAHVKRPRWMSTS
jgi:hypothetical protein